VAAQTISLRDPLVVLRAMERGSELVEVGAGGLRNFRSWWILGATGQRVHTITVRRLRATTLIEPWEGDESIYVITPAGRAALKEGRDALKERRDG